MSISETNSLEYSEDRHKGHRKNSSLTLDGMTLPHILLILLAIGILGVTIYLTKHFYQVHYSDDLTIGAICDFSQFWSCDKAAFSPLGSILNVPLSTFGLLFALFLIIGSIFPSKEMEGTNYFISAINLLGCLFLFLYSLIALKGLCLMCSIYYLLSALVFVLYFKRGIKNPRPSMKILGGFAVFGLMVSGGFAYKVSEAQDRQDLVAKDLIQQFYSLPSVGEPESENSAKLYMSTEKFQDAPIRLSLFSDFQCPACKMLSERITKVIQNYKGKVNIQYFYYPLDQNCNPNLKHELHAFACKAAYLAVCMPDKFPEVHDDLFAHQDQFSEQWINDYAKKHKKEACIIGPSTKEAVTKSIAIGDKFKVSSTPTVILNGIKISLPPMNHLYAIFDEIIKRAKK